MAVIVKPVGEALRVQPAPEGRSIPECSVFEHENWNTNEGDHDGWSFRTTLRVIFIGDDWNDQISSVIVYSGRWRFYKDINFGGPSFELGPGHHNVPPEFNDQISSYEPVGF